MSNEDFGSTERILRHYLDVNKGKGSFLEHEVKGLLRQMGLHVPRGVYVEKEAVGDIQKAVDIPYPLVAKVSSSKITSKSDVLGVLTGIRSESELEDAVDSLIRIENAQGVLIEEMAPPGVEVIIGGIIDSQFGPVVMFGLGGIFAELFRDVAFALAPLRRDDALWLVRQVKGSRLLQGYRGKSPVDMDTLVRVLIILSEIIETKLLAEIDLNPVALYPKGAIVLDAKLSIAVPAAESGEATLH